MPPRATALLPALIFLAAVISLTLHAQSPSPAQVPDPTAVAQALNSATAPDAAHLLDTFPLDQVPALIAAVTPENFPPDSHDAILQSLANLVRRAQAARLKADLAAEQVWNKRTGLNAYLVSPYRSPAWDKLATDAFSDPDFRTPAPFNAAIAAGCKDPLIRYYAVRRGLIARSLAPHDGLAEYLALAPDLMASAYSPGRKFQLQLQILNLALTDLAHNPQNAAVALNAYRQAVALLPTLAPEKPSLPVLRGAFNSLFRAVTTLHLSLKSSFLPLDSAMKTLLPDDAYANGMRAEFDIAWAWDARGVGSASTVSDDGWKLFNERLALADQAATAGARHDPLNPLCPAVMITICMGHGDQRPAMEKWFTRALLASPDNYNGCVRKLEYLRPRWEGSSEAQIEFGRQCLDTGSVASRIPTILLDAHMQVAEDTGNADLYLSQPAVWADIDAVYKKLLADDKAEHATNNLQFDHAKYIYYAARCQQWATVLHLMDKFQDDVDMNVFGSKAVYHFYRKTAEQHLAKTPT